MRFGRIMLVVGSLATLGLVAAGVQGHLAVEGGPRSPSLGTHVLLGLVALLFFVLAHGWILLYLVGMRRLLRRAAREARREEVLEPPLRSFRSRTLPPLVSAVGSGIAVFVLGTAVYAGRVPAPVHGALLWVTVALHAWAAAVEWRALAASERSLRALKG